MLAVLGSASTGSATLAASSTWGTGLIVARARTRRIGILTAGGDSPGLNAAIRGFGKTAIGHYGMELLGFRDGITGLVTNRHVRLDASALSGILTIGGTILGTSRDKVHRFDVGGEVRDMVPTVVENCEREGLDALILLGGGGTAKNAKRLMDAGLKVLHLRRGRDRPYGRPPAQIPACGTTALGSWLESNAKGRLVPRPFRDLAPARAARLL